MPYTPFRRNDCEFSAIPLHSNIHSLARRFGNLPENLFANYCFWNKFEDWIAGLAEIIDQGSRKSVPERILPLLTLEAGMP